MHLKNFLSHLEKVHVTSVIKVCLHLAWGSRSFTKNCLSPMGWWGYTFMDAITSTPSYGDSKTCTQTFSVLVLRYQSIALEGPMKLKCWMDFA